MEFNKEMFFEAIKQIAEQNLLTQKETQEIIEESVFKTFHTKFDPDAELTMIIDEKIGKFELINNNKIVVEDVEFNPEYRALEIPLSEAKKLKKNIQEGDIISEEVDFTPFAKHISNQVRQLITQNVREKKKAAVYSKHKSLKGEMINATVTSSTNSYVIFALEDGTTAFMPSKLRNLNIPLNIGEKVKVFVEDVLLESKDSQIVVSNGSPTMVKRVIEAEVPEVIDGTIEIVNISRIAGFRSKVAVRSNNPEVDPVGAIIGAAGSRIGTIVEKLQGEKLDIIQWTDNTNLYIANSLSPAKVIAVLDKKDDEGKTIEGHKIIITPNKHQTLAIGKQGSNARLSVELTNTRIDVISIDSAKEKGILFEWNGNVDESELAGIEAGIRQQRKPTRNSAPNIKSMDLELDITSFAEDIEMETEKQHVDNGFEIEDTMFSEDELKQMEANFEFDSELGDFETDEEYEASVNEDLNENQY